MPFLKAETLPSCEKCFAITVEKGELTTRLFLTFSSKFSQGSNNSMFFAVSASVFEDFPSEYRLFFSNYINFEKWLT